MNWHGSVITYKPKGMEINNSRAPDSTTTNLRVSRNIYVDRICRNDRNQTKLAVAQIMELICRVIKRNFPSVIIDIVIAYNAGTYSNNLIPFNAPFIFRIYGLKFRRVINSETEDLKGPADVHFATATSFLDQYIDTEGLDFVTPTDLFNTLNHSVFMNVCTAELLETNKRTETYDIWHDGLQKGEVMVGWIPWVAIRNSSTSGAKYQMNPL